MSNVLTLRAAIAKFEAWANKHLAPGTVADYHRHLDRFAKAVGDIAVGELRAHHLVDWGKTWHNIVSVQRCFNWLVEVEYIERSPFNRVKRPRPGRRKRIFTRAEFLRLCRAASPDFRRFLIAMRETIARPQEVRALRWRELESSDERLTVKEALPLGKAFFAVEEYKSRERRADPDALRIIPVSRRLGRMLLLQLGDAGVSDFVLLTGRRRPWTKEATRLRMARLRRRLGMARDLRGEHLVCYSVRHTSATAACVKGIRDRLLADIMGHTNTRTTSRYLHAAPSDLLNAIERLGRARPSSPPPPPR